MEVDETYIGGLEKNKHVGKKANLGRGASGKAAVAGAKDRATGRVAARVVHATDRQTLQGFVRGQIGIEVKILAKAMIKQIGRVQNDLRDQVAQFQRGIGTPICVGIVGVNHADYCISYEGEQAWPTDGVRHKHPIQEAEIAEQRLREEVGTKFDELLFLRYKATNDEPYPFEWASYADTFQDYGAALTRISRAYDTRFGP